MSTLPFAPHASWISSPAVGTPVSGVPAPYLRKSFTLEQPVRSARLLVTALGLYECEINGQPVGDEVLAPGWTDYSKRVMGRNLDVTSLLQVGENALGALLGDGWYSGFVAWKPRQLYGDRPRFLAQLDITLADGRTLSLATDETWLTTPSPIRENDLLMGETYDARLELGPWSAPGFDAASWLPVIVEPITTDFAIEERLGPPVRRITELTPRLSRSENKGGRKRAMFDFAQNFSGRVRFTGEAPRGTIVRLRFAEILDEKGELYLENLRSARATDVYICRGGGPETWEPRFTFHGFRYVELEGVEAGQISSLTGLVLYSDMPVTGHFRCSHELLNQLQSNIQWGQRSNFLEIPTDCPQRDERLGWTGDAQVFIRTAAFNMDVREFFHKWMRDLRDTQGEDGRIPPVAPNKGFMDHFLGDPEVSGDGGPAWADAMVICPWTIYLCYGDTQILQDNYEAMKRFVAFLVARRCAEGIRSHRDADPWGGFGDWLAMDGSGRTEGGTPKDLIGTAFLGYDAEIMAQVAEVLGHAEDAAAYRALREATVQAFRRRFITPDGLVVSGTQTAMVLALHFQLVEGEQARTLAAELAHDIRQRDYHLTTGFVGTPYLTHVLEEHGYLDVAYRLLEQETFPSWLFPVKNGATTIWERWDGWTPERGPQDKGMNSYNHYAYGAVGAWMYRTVAGLDLDPAQPGYRQILFRPRPGGSITWAEASLETPQGVAKIHWEQTVESLALELIVPEGSQATLLPPPHYGEPRPLAAGRHSITLKRSIAAKA